MGCWTVPWKIFCRTAAPSACSASGFAGPGSTRRAHRAPQIPKTGCRVSAFGDDSSREKSVPCGFEVAFS
jgi:hypothetical protein